MTNVRSSFARTGYFMLRSITRTIKVECRVYFYDSNIDFKIPDMKGRGISLFFRFLESLNHIFSLKVMDVSLD